MSGSDPDQFVTVAAGYRTLLGHRRHQSVQIIHWDGRQDSGPDPDRVGVDAAGQLDRA